MVDPLIIHFYGAGQRNYGKEMLYYRWLLSPACTLELQRAILTSGLVNWSGTARSFKPIDQGQEHHNLQIATSLKNFKNSTHDIDIVFDRLCLTNTAIASVRSQLETTFGEYMPGDHTVANTRLDSLMLAKDIYNMKLTRPRQRAELQLFSSFFASKDIQKEGMNTIHTHVDTFNKSHVKRSGQSFLGRLQVSESAEYMDIVGTVPFADLSDIEEDADYQGNDDSAEVEED
jgi:hypothetical protein